MQTVLRNKGLYSVTMGREVKPQQYIEKSKYLNKIYESFGFMCIHISRELLFHLDGLKIPKELCNKIESLFGKQDELRGHILENEMIALQPNNFETIQQFFSKFKSLFIQHRNCKIEKKDEKLLLSILRKLASEISVLLSIFHSRGLKNPNWRIPSIDSFTESLIQEQDKSVQMGYQILQ